MKGRIEVTNFEYLLQEPSFCSFAQPAVTAEKVYSIDKSSAMFNIRKSLENALLFVAEMEDIHLYKTSLYDLIGNYKIRDTLDNPRLVTEMDLLRKMGNSAVHTGKEQNERSVLASFVTLFNLLDWIAYNYAPLNSDIYKEGRTFNRDLLKDAGKEQVSSEVNKTVQEQQEEINRLREALAQEEKKRLEREKYVNPPLEKETRLLYIDEMLRNAGWKKNRNWLEEVEVDGMPTQTGRGYVDYVLYEDDQVPLAIVEAKKTTEDLAKGRQQAKLYADSLERKYGRRPVIFLTNGLETTITDGEYPERRVSDIYSKRDLEKLFNLRMLKEPLEPVHSSDRIAGRYYQKAAIKAICHVLKQKKRRALLVMATGSGKTRTAAALIDYLVRKNWAKNVLFLADRTMLVSQAKAAIVNNLPNLSVTNLSKEKDNPEARVVVSTYQSMIGCIDDTKGDDNERIFTPGHFDLIICDEVHRSIYKKYQDIFTYFDAPILGLTATPKDDVDRDTYKMFNLEKGNPTYAYTLEQGVKDGHLVPYRVIETGTKFMEEGISYDDLDEDEREDYEQHIHDEEGRIIYKFESEDVNKVIFNKDTIRKILGIVMEYGLKVDYGSKIGKTIIFARNHRHAEEILKVFNEEYPEYGPDFAQVIDNKSYDPEQQKEDFAKRDSNPQIAISVDMLETGVDIPSVLNLVFFKEVFTKSKFWQMVGRGTRLCENLIDGRDKTEFLIFDFFGNFERFSKETKPEKGHSALPVQGAIFKNKAGIVMALQEEKYQDPDLQNYRRELIEQMANQVGKLNRQAFNVHQHLEAVDHYRKDSSYRHLTESDIQTITRELSHLIQPVVREDIHAVRFDALIYGIELDLLQGKSVFAGWKDVQNKAGILLNDYVDVPQVSANRELLESILKKEDAEDLDIRYLENVRKTLRSLMKFIVNAKQQIYYTDYSDTLKDVTERDPIYEAENLENYRIKTEKYIREHEDLPAIKKLKNNEPLTNGDIMELEKVLWNDLGTKADYVAEFNDQPLGEFVRSITGLDQKAAKEAFAAFLDDAQLDEDQINFVNTIIEYLVQNGTMELSVLQQSPFTDIGGVMLFKDNLPEFIKLRDSIQNVNERASTVIH